MIKKVFDFRFFLTLDVGCCCSTFMVSSGGELVANGGSGPAYIRPTIRRKFRWVDGDRWRHAHQSSGHQGGANAAPEPEAGKGSCSFFPLQVGAKCASACFIRPSAGSLADRARRANRPTQLPGQTRGKSVRPF